MVASEILWSGREREVQYFARLFPVERGDTISGEYDIYMTKRETVVDTVCTFLFLGQIALPYPFCTWPRMRMRAEGDKQEAAKKMYFGAVPLSFCLDLDVCTA